MPLAWLEVMHIISNLHDPVINSILWMRKLRLRENTGLAKATHLLSC